MQTNTNIQLSPEFYFKAISSGLTDESNEFNWIWKDILGGKTLSEIAEKFFAHTEWDGDCFTDTSSGILNAYLMYKNGHKIPLEDLRYLRNRSGVITSKCIDEEENFEPIYHHFTCLDLIEELDGTDFFDYLNKK